MILVRVSVAIDAASSGQVIVEDNRFIKAFQIALTDLKLLVHFITGFN
jgi:hypothetical protein